MKILVIGDPHFRPSLGYADYIQDRREKEKKDILDFIVSSSDDCDAIVIMGDCFDSRNPVPKVIKEFINFVEKFNNKKIYIISGNHDSFGNGKTTIDFMKEISGKNWEIITGDTVMIEQDKAKLSFCKYFTKAELGTKDKEASSLLVKDKLKDGDILFIHHAISKTKLGKSELTTDIFPEPILPRAELEDKYKVVVGGHIHTPNKSNNTIITGSLFCNEVGDTEKFVWKIDTSDYKNIEQIKLPGRGIYKLVDPKDSDIDGLSKNNIVKVVVTKKTTTEKTDELKEKLRKFDSYVYVESIADVRKKTETKNRKNLLELTVEELMVEYAKSSNKSINELMSGFELIKT